MACQGGYVGIVKALLDAGAGVNDLNPKVGFTKSIRLILYCFVSSQMYEPQIVCLR